jgi:CelD/BcsL family acetyltransferase involved in cellulose biosynthesis
MTEAGPGLTLRRMPYDDADWGRVVNAHADAEVYHGPEWLSYLGASQGAEPVVAQVLEGDQLRGHFVGAIVRRWGLRVLGSPLSGWGTQVMGFLIDDDLDRRRALEAARTFAYRDLGCAHIELGDRKIGATDVAGTPFGLVPGETLVVDLTGSESDVLGQMHPRTRTYARRAAKTGLRAEVATGAAFADEYYDQLLDVFHSSGLVPTYGRERVRQLIEALEPSGQVVMVRLRAADGTPVATTIGIGRNERAVMWGAAFYRDHASLHPVEPLQWEAMRAWRERGIAKYDLSGNFPSKAKFGRIVEPLHRVHHSRYPILEHGRTAVRSLFYARQRLAGRRFRDRQPQPDPQPVPEAVTPMPGRSPGERPS